MKVDFNKDGMTIKFDKVPRLIYFNEEGSGVGQVYFDGVRRKGLQKVRFEAQTADEKGRPPLKYRIQYVEAGANEEPQFISNMQEGLSISVKITDLEIFEKLIEWAKSVISDERISEEAREEYYERLNEVIYNKTVTMYADERVCAVFKEEEK